MLPDVRREPSARHLPSSEQAQVARIYLPKLFDAPLQEVLGCSLAVGVLAIAVQEEHCLRRAWLPRDHRFAVLRHGQLDGPSGQLLRDAKDHQWRRFGELALPPDRA